MDVDLMVFVLIFGVIAIFCVLWVANMCRKNRKREKLSASRHCWCASGQTNHHSVHSSSSSSYNIRTDSSCKSIVHVQTTAIPKIVPDQDVQSDPEVIPSALSTPPRKISHQSIATDLHIRTTDNHDKKSDAAYPRQKEQRIKDHASLPYVDIMDAFWESQGFYASEKTSYDEKLKTADINPATS